MNKQAVLRGKRGLRTLFEAGKVAGSATYKQREPVWYCVVLKCHVHCSCWVLKAFLNTWHSRVWRGISLWRWVLRQQWVRQRVRRIRRGKRFSGLFLDGEYFWEHNYNSICLFSHEWHLLCFPFKVSCERALQVLQQRRLPGRRQVLVPARLQVRTDRKLSLRDWM